MDTRSRGPYKGSPYMVRTRARSKRYFTPAEASRVLPLVRAIVREVVDITAEVKVLAGELGRPRLPGERREVVEGEIEARRDRLMALRREVDQLGIELKDFERGLVDFPALHHGEEVCICWCFGEDTIAWWHDRRTGFTGRRPIATLETGGAAAHG